MKSYFFTIAILLSAPPAQAEVAPPIRWPAAKTIGPECNKVIAAAKLAIAKLEKLPLTQVKQKNLLGLWNRLDIELQDASSPIYLLSEVSPQPETRKAAEECILKLSALDNEIYQSRALYQRFLALKPKDAIDRMARKIMLEQFEDRGVNLSEKKRREARAFFERLDKLQQDFSRNLRDNETRLVFTPEELRGVPRDFLDRAKRDEQGRYQIGFDPPEADAIMANAENGEVRRRYQFAASRRGSEANLKILRDVVAIRKQLSGLFGYPSYAHWSTRGKMVERPEVVNKFLSDVAQRVEAAEKNELNELVADKIKHVGSVDPTLQRWDIFFYQQRLKKRRYSVDSQIVRAQFPTEPTLAWLLNVSSRLYDVEFRLNPRLPVWHPEVRGYDVYERATQKYLSSFYLDLFPRDGKYKHAAAFGLRGVSTQAGRTPVSALVTNFSRDGFDQNELETLFHEFGHILHGVLSKTRYLLHAGTAVRRDFVEAPSQMYEEWTRRPESLRLFNDTCPDCKPIDLQLIERMVQAHQFGQAIKYSRQRLYAAYDMHLASADPGEPMQVWMEMEGNTVTGHVPGTQFPGTFGHIVGGYAAGYYGYMWSEVLALDMLSPFADNVMDKKVAGRYRRIVLENGGQVPPMQLVEEFLGRKPSPAAFFEEITGKRRQTSGMHKEH